LPEQTVGWNQDQDSKDMQERDQECLQSVETSLNWDTSLEPGKLITLGKLTTGTVESNRNLLLYGSITHISVIKICQTVTARHHETNRQQLLPCFDQQNSSHITPQLQHPAETSTKSWTGFGKHHSYLQLPIYSTMNVKYLSQAAVKAGPEVIPMRSLHYLCETNQDIHRIFH